MSTTDDTNAARRGSESNDLLGLVERLRRERRPTRWNRGVDTDYPVAWEPDPLCQEAASELAANSDQMLRAIAALNAARAERDALSVEVQALREFRDFFIDRCEGLFHQWGMRPVDLFNATKRKA